MQHMNCLNCNSSVDNNFCPSCGQKTDTHPITFKHFMLHDLLHGVWHLEKGILFTLKEVITRPGQAALDYISGKRIRYYNVFYLALLIIALDVVLLHYKNSLIPEVENTIPRAEDFGAFISRFSKIALFSLVPLLALNANLLFKRLRLNFTEHLIIGGITLLGILLISVFLFLFELLNQLGFPDGIGYLKVTAFLVMLLFPVWVYQNATRRLYKSWGFLWRIFGFYLLLLTELLMIITFISVVFLKGNSQIYMSV